MRWTFFIFSLIEVLGMTAFFYSAYTGKEPIKRRKDIIMGEACLLGLLLTWHEIFSGVY